MLYEPPYRALLAVRLVWLNGADVLKVAWYVPWLIGVNVGLYPLENVC